MKENINRAKDIERGLMKEGIIKKNFLMKKIIEIEIIKTKKKNIEIDQDHMIKIINDIFTRKKTL
jgi:hypothetical protein